VREMAYRIYVNAKRKIQREFDLLGTMQHLSSPFNEWARLNWPKIAGFRKSIGRLGD